MAIGKVLRQARAQAGLDLSTVALLGYVSKGHLVNVESGRRTATPAVITAYEKALGMHRRSLFKLAGMSLGTLAVGGDDADVARELYSSIASGDDGPLTIVQTSHAIDHAIKDLAVRETRNLSRMATWMTDGSDPVLRVNAAGILAKSGSPDLADDVALALDRDPEARGLYIQALRARIGDAPDAWAGELSNATDSGARWCAAHLLAQTGHTRPLIAAMRTEPSRENLRHLALASTAHGD